MINWRSIAEVGYPTDDKKNYLVADGKDISVSAISVKRTYNADEKTTTFISWHGDENTWEDNSCCSGERMFDLTPTHWCPTDEINLP